VVKAGKNPENQPAESNPGTVIVNSGALTCVDLAGQRRRVIENLPYVLYTESGVSASPTGVAEMDGTLYLLTGEGYGDLSRKLLRLGTSGTPQVVADFLKFAAQGKPLEYISPSSIEANPYAIIPDPANRRFSMTDGASGQVLSAGLNSEIGVFSPTEDHLVVTGIARGPVGLAYFASFSQLPHSAGAGAIYRLQPESSAAVTLGNLTTPIALAFDRAGRLYTLQSTPLRMHLKGCVLEFIYTDAEANPYPGKTGRLLRFERQSDDWSSGQVLVEGLTYPTALLFGSDDSLYVSVYGAFSPADSGRVIRFVGLADRKPGQSPF